MIFNSIEFLLFLPIVFILYWHVFKQKHCQNALIVVSSYIFYGWWDVRFLSLILLTSICSYISGILIEKYVGKRRIQLFISTANIVLNLGILVLFKYYNFFVENLDLIFSELGFQLDWATINIVLPVGISFYTFQALSYTIDVYRCKIKPTHDPVEFLAFISFFPQLVAGPIERATNLLPQFQNNRQFDYNQAVDGCRQILWGFFKKMVIADNCAIVVNYIFSIEGQNNGFPGLTYLIGGVLFTIQIYCDFSGYSDIAIGCARLFGFTLLQNFNYPYFSRSIPEFWRKWHISLTTWFRDYIYFPLGGSRCKKWKIIRNVYIVWAISGLWHGANWTFIFWGVYHGTLLAIYNLLSINKKNNRVIAGGRLFPSMKELFQIIVSLSLAIMGWIIFRAETMTDVMFYFSTIFSSSIFEISDTIESLKGYGLMKIIVFSSFMFSLEWVQRDKQHALQFMGNNCFLKYSVLRYSFYIFLVMITIALAGTQSQFIYFQF